ncbi:hypothetical protein FACS1894191_0710 [Clostridia bacterium]|nr:hypothetical protein FACS1894191_0710 [Clostridia bacterium]
MNVEKCIDWLELDELYWFIGQKADSETRENVYLMTMVSREPRQIAGFEVATDKSAAHIQRIVDNAPPAERYCTDGYIGYCDVVYPGEHVRNMRDKSDTYTVEGVNADLRHYFYFVMRLLRFRRKGRISCKRKPHAQRVVFSCNEFAGQGLVLSLPGKSFTTL